MAKKKAAKKKAAKKKAATWADRQPVRWSEERERKRPPSAPENVAIRKRTV